MPIAILLPSQCNFLPCCLPLAFPHSSPLLWYMHRDARVLGSPTMGLILLSRVQLQQPRKRRKAQVILARVASPIVTFLRGLSLILHGDPSPLPEYGFEYLTEGIKQAVKASYNKCAANKEVQQPHCKEHASKASSLKQSSQFRIKRLTNRQIRTKRHRARLQPQNNRNRNSVQAAMDCTVSKL